MTAVRRLLLIRHGGTTATRRGDFAVDEPLTPQGKIAAAGLARWASPNTAAVSSPTRRARETALAAGWVAAVDDRLAPLDAGLWTGQTLQQIGLIDPQGMVRWLSDPAARPHGGETIVELLDRMRGLLAQWHDPAVPDLVAITHGALIRAAVVLALGAPPEAFWQVEAAPASLTELHTRGPRWVLTRVNA